MAGYSEGSSLRAVLYDEPQGARQSRPYVSLAKQEYTIFRRRLGKDAKKLSYIESALDDIERRQDIGKKLDAVQSEFMKYLKEHEQYVVAMIGDGSYRNLPQVRQQPPSSPHVTEGSLGSRTDPNRSVYANQRHVPRQPVSRPDSYGGNQDSRRDEMQASIKLRVGNPGIANLSDPNRPTKLAERLSEIYDNSWTDAFEEQNRASTRFNELETVMKLLNTLQDAYSYCQAKADSQIEEMVDNIDRVLAGSQKLPDYRPEGDRGLLVHYRKDIAGLSLPNLKESFMKKYIQELPKTRLYAEECLQTAWWMQVQDPPLHLQFDFRSGDRFDNDLLRPYTKSGQSVDFLVWPAVRLAKDGPLVAKGVAQGK